MVMQAQRVLRHLAMTPWGVRGIFSSSVLTAIETAIRENETRHLGEIRFAVEGALHLRPLLHGQIARERALEVFANLRVWDTEHNNGVLIYLLLADRNVEIVADRGIHHYVGDTEWERICRDMENHFRTGQFQEGVIAGIRAIGAHLSEYYPAAGPNLNELPDSVKIL